MRTRLKNLSEVAHIWAQQSQHEGRCSNVFFIDTKIYSYGYHFLAANFVRPDLCLITTRKYSVTTAKHMHEIYGAIHSAKIINCPNVEPTTKEDHTKNLIYFSTQRNNCLFDAKNSHKKTGWLINQAKMYNGIALDYCQEFKLGRRLSNPFTKFGPFITPELQAKIDKQEFNVQHAKEIQEQKDRVKFSEIYNIVLPFWLRGESVPSEIQKSLSYSFTNVNELKESYLRVSKDGNNVETSHGASVLLREARVLYNFIATDRDVKGFKIGSYTVISMNGVLTIGCHKIERTEIERFAKTQNW